MENDKKILNISKKITKAIEKALSNQNMSPLVNNMAKDIKKRTRLGYGVSSFNSQKYKFPPLRDRTVEKRQELFEKGKLSGLTTPNKSNLTEKGLLLDALIGKSNSKGRISFEFRENRGDGKSNKKIASEVSKKRPFLNISSSELKRFTNQFMLKIKQEIAKIVNEE